MTKKLHHTEEMDRSFNYFRKRGNPAAATMRSNRTKNAPLKSEKELKKSGRGAFDAAVSTDGILIVSWYDNKQVSLR